VPFRLAVRAKAVVDPTSREQFVQVPHGGDERILDVLDVARIDDRAIVCLFLDSYFYVVEVQRLRDVAIGDSRISLPLPLGVVPARDFRIVL
jgi:hypothetical protein